MARLVGVMRALIHSVRKSQFRQEEIMDDKEIVSAILANLADRVGHDRFELWFGGNVRLSLGESALVVDVPNRFSQDWLRRNFRADLESACQEILGRSLLLEFRVDEALPKASGWDNRAQTADLELVVAGESDVLTLRSTAIATTLCEPVAPHCLKLADGLNLADDPALADQAKQHGMRDCVVQAKSSTRPVRSAVHRTRGNGQAAATAVSNGPQRRRFANLGSFVVGSNNRLAHASAELAVERLGTMNPLFIHGPTGVGKTHLLEGIWSAVRQKQGQSVYLTAEQFTTQFLEALRGSGLPNFRRKYRSVDVLILDDIHFFAGKRATLIELLHTIDTLMQQGRQLILAADRAPGELKDLGAELTARLAAGMVSRLDPPDHAVRLGIIRQRAAAIGLQLCTEVEQYVATHLTTHARELLGAINRLQAVSRIQNQPVSLAMAEESLSEMIRQYGRSVQLNDIEKAVCDVFGLGSESLQSERRAKALNTPRMLAMWLARKHTRSALSEIGKYFGGRSHSTVISAQKTVGDWVTSRTQVDLNRKNCDIDDAIREVEARLRTG
ncbi:MAG: chromosomal replication initiator protein DnaA [Planctomycetota bacterium]|nr:chromosomal replication initiator protein DnaA [Planctomycetota bacterium]